MSCSDDKAEDGQWSLQSRFYIIVDIGLMAVLLLIYFYRIWNFLLSPFLVVLMLLLRLCL